MSELKETPNQLQAINKIVTKNFNGSIIGVTNLTDGYSGYVYEVQIASIAEHYAVKLTPFEIEPSLDEESVDTRVYGTRLSNFDSAYQLLAKHNIAVPKIYAYGQPTTEIPYIYQVMSLLEGVSVRPFLSHKTGEKMEELHRVVGEQFGKAHAITRPYDGWVNQEKPYGIDWENAFFAALEHRLKTAFQINANINSQKEMISLYVTQQHDNWVNPTEFVLSDIDGFQGMAKFENGIWSFTGLIDIEDHKYMDQRMALAGYELSLEYERRNTPSQFWEGYKAHKEVDPTYNLTKNLFQLYYLLSWLPMVYEQDWRGNPNDRSDVIKKFEGLILERTK